MCGVLFPSRMSNWFYQSEPDPNLNNRSIFIPRGKALGALGMGFGGQELEKRYGAVPGFIQAVQGLSEGNLVPVRGGVLIRDAQGQLLGAVGVSGETSANDEICAVAGIESTGLTPDCGGPKP